MDADRLLTAFMGAFLGAAGWLMVGLFIQRQQFARVARRKRVLKRHTWRSERPSTVAASLMVNAPATNSVTMSARCWSRPVITMVSLMARD